MTVSAGSVLEFRLEIRPGIVEHWGIKQMTELSLTPAAADYDERAMQHLAVDAEHLGIRVVVPLLAFVVLLVVVFVGPSLLDSLGLYSSVVGLLLIPGAIGAAIGAAYVGDRLLKRYWPSGRELLFDERNLVLKNKRQPARVIRLDVRVNLLTWRFVVARRGRVPKGFLCLSIQVLQDEQEITLYTFYDPKKTDAIKDLDSFTLLASRKMMNDERLSLRVAGEQRRLLQAEDTRWESGAELSPADFLALWQALRSQRASIGE